MTRPPLPPGYRVFARDDEKVWWHCEGPGLPTLPRVYAYPSELEAAAACWAASQRLHESPPLPPGWTWLEYQEEWHSDDGDVVYALPGGVIAECAVDGGLVQIGPIPAAVLRALLHEGPPLRDESVPAPGWTITSEPLSGGRRQWNARRCEWAGNAPTREDAVALTWKRHAQEHAPPTEPTPPDLNPGQLGPALASLPPEPTPSGEPTFNEVHAARESLDAEHGDWEPSWNAIIRERALRNRAERELATVREQLAAAKKGTP